MEQVQDQKDPADQKQEVEKNLLHSQDRCRRPPARYPKMPQIFLELQNSQVSISHLSTTGCIRPDVEVPELSFGHNPRLPSASSGIDLQFSPERGRYFIATRDLGPGDVILREEPFAAVLESVFRVNHCGHCLRKTSTPIPCYECATVQYCGETCRDLSWEQYHRWEVQYQIS